jgi:uncharacterized membrane protein YfcA
MGLILSLLGAGGSILTMPILVYLFFIPVVEATSYSLLIVGLTALFGSIEYFRRKSIDIKTAISFGAPSIIGVLIARKYLLPSVPDQFIFGILITKDFIIMIIFSTLMILASVMMLKKDNLFSDQKYTRDKKNYFIIVVEGFIIGVVTGFVGAGGGFIIIPALVLLAGLDMKIAVGTSLIIIAFKSIIGFSSDYINGSEIDWIFILYVMLATVFGVIIGNYFSKKLTSNQLKNFFGKMILIIGTYIVIEQIFSL